MLFDVWIPDWEIECCYAPPSVGQRWNGSVAFAGSVRLADPDEATQLRRTDEGEIQFVAPVVYRAEPPRWMREGPAAVVEAESLHVLVREAPDADHLSGVGRLHMEIHGPSPLEELEENLADRFVAKGVVKRMWVIPDIYEERDEPPDDWPKTKRSPLPRPRDWLVLLRARMRHARGSFRVQRHKPRFLVKVGEGSPIEVSTFDRDVTEGGYSVRMEIELLQTGRT